MAEDTAVPKPKTGDVEVLLIRDWDVHKTGDVIKLPAANAASLVAHMVATDEAGAVATAKAAQDAKHKSEAQARIDERSARRENPNPGERNG